MDAWLESAAKGAGAEQQVQLLDVALAALWARTSTILGEVTLGAIVDRVLHNAAEKFPVFSALSVEASRGIECSRLKEQIASLPDAEVIEGVRFVLVEFLTVIGHLTAELLTPELHAELSKISVAGGRRS